MNNTVTIDEDYFNELLETEEFLELLYECGVDHWPGYEMAMRAFIDQEVEF